jgi:hypothetical protein
MFLVNHPGPWQSFLNRPDNKGLSLMEVKNKYMQEQLLFENYMSFQHQQQLMMSNISTGGGPLPTTTTTPEPLPSSCIQFVNNTSLGTNSLIDFATSGPTNFTINWGDGTIFSDAIDGSYNISHTYPELDQSYTCTLCFDDISLVTELDFQGDR